MRTRPLNRLTPLTPTRGQLAFAPTTGLASPPSLLQDRGGEAHPLALVPTAPDESRWSRLARFAAIEVVVWGVLYSAYLAVRSVTIGEKATALGHAADVISAERAIGLFHEAAIQGALQPVAGFFSTYYMLGFGPVIASMLVWLGLRRPELYRELRTALLVSLALATVVFVVFPTAPPRLVDELGITDTVGLSSGHDTGSFLGVRFNPYAAVPSMHVGWSLLVGIFGFRATRRRLARCVFLVHPALMAVTVTATGNHYLLDAAGGVAVALLTLWLLRLRGSRPRVVPPLSLVEPARATSFVHTELERKAA